MSPLRGASCVLKPAIMRDMTTSFVTVLGLFLLEGAAIAAPLVKHVH